VAGLQVFEFAEHLAVVGLHGVITAHQGLGAIAEQLHVEHAGEDVVNARLQRSVLLEALLQLIADVDFDWRIGARVQGGMHNGLSPLVLGLLLKRDAPSLRWPGG
jgi:hypothetical protein